MIFFVYYFISKNLLFYKHTKNPIFILYDRVFNFSFILNSFYRICNQFYSVGFSVLKKVPPLPYCILNDHKLLNQLLSKRISLFTRNDFKFT